MTAQQIDNELLEIIGHLGAAEIQASACDDQIIMGHVKDAYLLTVALRRHLIADQRRDDRMMEGRA